MVQNDAGNRFSPFTIVAAIHHDTKKGLPVCVSVPAGKAGLSKDSVIDCGHLMTIRSEILEKELGVLPRFYMKQVEAALKVSLELG